MGAGERLVAVAERLFDRHGFMATGLERLTKAAGISTRALYKHTRNKTTLAAAVLARRHGRMMDRTDVGSVDAFFVALEDWCRTEGARGCLFLRAYGETGGDAPEVAEAVMTHKTALRDRIGAIVAADMGPGHDPALSEQILMLAEGAMAAVVYRGPEAVGAARAAASVLTAQARQ